MIDSITIRGRKIGSGAPVYFVAEMSANHHQNYSEADALVRAAKEAGADAIKLQTYTSDTMTIPARNKHFSIGEGTIWEGRNLHDLYGEAATPWEWHPKLKELAESIGLDFFSTPFDTTAVEFLESMDVPVHKIASFEVVDLPLIRCIAQTGKPIIMSTGMASLAEIDEAVSVARAAGAKEIALLKCTSAYPALPSEMNLRTIPHLSEAFRVPVGLSDHTLGIAVPMAAVALGACIIEKHFTSSRAVEGPDSVFSLEPEEFKSMVASVRIIEAALGTVSYELTEQQRSSLGFRRSLFVVDDVEKGQLFTEKNVRCIRPGYGMHPRYLETVLGRTAACDVHKGTPLTWDLVGGQPG